jgi:hypothetical protein
MKKSPFAHRNNAVVSFKEKYNHYWANRGTNTGKIISIDKLLPGK